MIKNLEFMLVMVVLALLSAFGVSFNLVSLPIASCFLLITFFSLFAINKVINKRFMALINK